MGLYVNPGNEAFEQIRKDIYVDKSDLISYINSRIGKPKPLISFSRPRRFGKSYTAHMLCAYYSRGCDSRFLFEDLKIADDSGFETHLNQYNVIAFDVTGFIKGTEKNGLSVLTRMQNALLEELRAAFPDCVIDTESDLGTALYAIVSRGYAKFVFVIDEWDALFREFKNDQELQKAYILFLRSLFKNADITPKVIAAAYMTGILPIKKYGTESALSDFDEFTMTKPLIFAPYVGFTENEVRALCEEYDVEFERMKQWYDGYSFKDLDSVYNPNSVMKAIKFRSFENYWTQTETFESLRRYIEMNFDGLQDTIISLLGGSPVRITISTFQNDITSFKTKDDVLTLLVHLGYLAYDQESSKASIPNLEVADAFKDAVSGESWEPVGTAISESEDLLEATLSGDAEAVANALETIHSSVSSVLQYNNEASLSCTLTIAYYTAKRFYNIIRELPTGKGFADLAFIPRRDTNKPALLVELKYNKDANSAIRQIHDNRYEGALKDYAGNLLLVGINYDKNARKENAKKHSCVIESA